MSSPKRACTSQDGTTAVEPPPPLPVDLLHEILARVDVATVVRCAATSKTVRRAILGDPTIGRRVDLLLGVSYAIPGHEIHRDIRTSVSLVGRQNHLGFNADRNLRRHEPVASRGGLIVLLERCPNPHWLHVWNTVDRSIQWVQLPTAAGRGYNDPSYDFVTVALLTVGDAGRSYQLLAVWSHWLWSSSQWSLRTQIYTKDDGWGTVTKITDLPPELKHGVPSCITEAFVLAGGTAVHWLHNDSGAWHIVRLDIDEAKATLITLPPECVHRRSVDELQLAASTDGKLSLVVAEHCEISMWKLSAAAAQEEGAPARWTWTRQVVIGREAISRDPTPTGLYKDHRDLFLGFGELSSTVLLLMHHVGLVRINLRTKEAFVLASDDELKEIGAAYDAYDDGLKKIEACLHEIDLPSVLLAMKPY